MSPKKVGCDPRRATNNQISIATVTPISDRSSILVHAQVRHSAAVALAF
jgi:hypothetical protein